MKRITAVLLTAALLTLSACNGAGEGQGEDLTESSSQVSEAVDMSSESSTSPEIYANWEDDLPLKLITDAVPFWTEKDAEWLAELDMSEYSYDWYSFKYISPYVVPLNMDFSQPSDMDANVVAAFFIRNMKAHIDPENYYNYELDKYAIPAEIIESFASAYFGIESLDNSQSEYYVSDGDYYLLPPSAFGGMWFYKVREVITDGNIIKIYIDWYDEYFTECWKSNVFKIEDNGDTFKYLYVRTLEPMGIYDDEMKTESETTATSDDTAESDSTESLEETTTSES